MHTGDHLAELLLQCGATHVFGVPGGQTSALFDGILKREPSLRHVIMRDECNVTFAADAFARVTHRVGICDVTVGPGCVKLPSGLMEAYYSSIPILCIMSELPVAWRHLYERGAALQAMEQEKLVAQFCKWVATLHSPCQLPTLLSTLLRRAVSGRPGPVALIIPQDVFDQDSSAPTAKIDGNLGRFPFSRSSPAESDVERAALLLAEASRPVLVAGGGVHLADAAAEARELAELLSMPVVTTFSGRAILPDDHPLSLGLVGNIGAGCARQAVEAADVVLLVGFKSGQNSTCNWILPRAGQKVIHLDLDPAEIGKVFVTEAGLIGDAQLGLKALSAAVKARTTRAARQNRVAQISAWREDWRLEVREALNSNATPITPQRVMHELNQVAKPEDTVCCDASYVTGWGMLFYQARRAGKVILAPRGSAGLGFGIPAAIGAACARPDSTIWALCGDHGVSYSIGELSTVVHYGLNIKVLVFNNQGSRWIDHYHRILFQGSGAPFRWGDTDFASVGRGYGCLGIRVEQPQEIAEALRQAAAYRGPAVVNISVSGEETPVTSYQKALREKRQQG
ncbi:MAG TPA: thiamine pyrophosphate-binding protein [Terriglobia bacterium]|nr:thiamine pyrophosphate-binding protein [Terriglobia bacterium]